LHGALSASMHDVSKSQSGNIAFSLGAVEEEAA